MRGVVVYGFTVGGLLGPSAIVKAFVTSIFSGFKR
jgi:hypothetical protein